MVIILQYTKEWINKVNRGGLFPLNNHQTFLLFTEIEKNTRTVLARHMNKKCTTHEDVIKNVEEIEEVQFHWTLISQSVEKKEDADWLLREIVKLYVTIRGFAMAASW